MLDAPRHWKLHACSHLACAEGDKAKGLALVGDRVFWEVDIDNLQQQCAKVT